MISLQGMAEKEQQYNVVLFCLGQVGLKWLYGDGLAGLCMVWCMWWCMGDAWHGAWVHGMMHGLMMWWGWENCMCNMKTTSMRR